MESNDYNYIQKHITKQALITKKGQTETKQNGIHRYYKPIGSKELPKSR